jgi:hypothetical protein
MAKKRYNSKKKSKGAKMQPAITDIFMKSKNSSSLSNRNYVDTARELSKINRRLYSQSRLYGYQGLTYIWRPATYDDGGVTKTLASIEVSIRTAGNTWLVQNAHTKGEALWHQMQDLVLEDNPSIKGKWHDYKVRLCDSQVTAREMTALDGQGTAYLAGEWNLSTYVMPQHETDPVPDPVTGNLNPLPAVEYTAMLIGNESATTRSLVRAYEESRATVSANQPNVPAAMSQSFFNLLTDSGSQEPELADVIEGENDNPPYDLDNYPGGDGNAPDPVVVQYGAVSSTEVDGRLGGFVAPCGLLELEIKGFDTAGDEFPAANMPEIEVILHVAPGAYKGVAAIPMGQ